jgi:hypothetical protein
MGHSVETLVAYYVGAVDGDEQAGNEAIGDYLDRANSRYSSING